MSKDIRIHVVNITPTLKRYSIIEHNKAGQVKQVHATKETREPYEDIKEELELIAYMNSLTKKELGTYLQKK